MYTHGLVPPQVALHRPTLEHFPPLPSMPPLKSALNNFVAPEPAAITGLSTMCISLFHHRQTGPAQPLGLA